MNADTAMTRLELQLIVLDLRVRRSRSAWDSSRDRSISLRWLGRSSGKTYDVCGDDRTENAKHEKTDNESMKKT